VASASVPQLIYGTAWKEERTEALTRLALESGFRGIDTANQRKHYFEVGVGAALRSVLAAGVVQRDAVFLQTKFTFVDGQDHRLPYAAKAPVSRQVEQSLQSSLEHLGTDYLDSYVLHGPSQSRGLGALDREAWAAMEAAQRRGQVRALGISNVTLEQLRALEAFAEVPPAFVQNRCYARYGWDREVRAYCRAHGSVYQGFSLLTANTRELARPALVRVTARTGRSAAEVVFAFAARIGIVALTGTSNAEHMQRDLAALALELSPSEVEAIERV
jgi:diketogulonate reductase-like aldo/keto reductase